LGNNCHMDGLDHMHKIFCNKFVQPATYVLYLAWSMSAASYASWWYMKWFRSAIWIHRNMSLRGLYRLSRFPPLYLFGCISYISHGLKAIDEDDRSIFFYSPGALVAGETDCAIPVCNVQNSAEKISKLLPLSLTGRHQLSILQRFNHKVTHRTL
jgi:hypothetical protein